MPRPRGFPGAERAGVYAIFYRQSPQLDCYYAGCGGGRKNRVPDDSTVYRIYFSPDIAYDNTGMGIYEFGIYDFQKFV